MYPATHSEHGHVTATDFIRDAGMDKPLLRIYWYKSLTWIIFMIKNIHGYRI